MGELFPGHGGPEKEVLTLLGFLPPFPDIWVNLRNLGSGNVAIIVSDIRVCHLDFSINFSIKRKKKKEREIQFNISIYP
jgi:hypothetical protein